MPHSRRREWNCSEHIRVIFLDTVDSTNDYAYQSLSGENRFLSGSAKNLVAIVSGEQTKGKGRLGRSWVSVPGESLTVSFIGSVPSSLIQSDLAGWLTAVAGVAAASGIQDYVDQACRASKNSQLADKGEGGGPVIGLKWPNDIYARGKKLGGILIRLATDRPLSVGGVKRAGEDDSEDLSSSEQADLRVPVIMGLGLNLAIPHIRFQEAGLQAISLVDLLDQSSLPNQHGTLNQSGAPDQSDVANELLIRIGGKISDLLDAFSKNPEQTCRKLAKQMQEKDIVSGRRVEVSTASGQVIEGVCRGIGPDASLIVELDDGSLRHINWGDAQLEDVPTGDSQAVEARSVEIVENR